MFLIFYQQIGELKASSSEKTESPEKINDWRVLSGGSLFGIILFMVALTSVVILVLFGREHKNEIEKKRKILQEAEIPMTDA